MSNKRKKFIKWLMAHHHSRNEAIEYTKLIVPNVYESYRRAYFMLGPSITGGTYVITTLDGRFVEFNDN